MRVTLRQIAKLAHVSMSTASKALHNSKEVNAETTAEVWKVALQYGYFTSKKEATLKNQKQIAPKIAILCPEIVSIFYTLRATKIAEQLEKKGASVQIFICDFDKDNTWKSIRKCMESIEVDGVVGLFGDDFEQEVKLPFVYMGKSAKHRYLWPDMDGGIEDAVERAKAKGHTRFAFLSELLTTPKAESFTAALRRNGIAEENGTVVVSKQRFEAAGYEDVGMLLSSGKEMPTFCLCAYDEIAIGAMKALREKGIRVPDDMEIMGINNIPAAAYCVPPLSSIGFDEETLCEQVANAILEEVLEEERPAQAQGICVPHKLYLRETFS